MQVPFTKSSPDWSATGTEPSADFKAAGFEAGYKPPASYFNWFWTQVSECITEIQNISAGQTMYAENGTNQGEVFNNYTYNTAEGAWAHAQNFHTTASGDYSHAGGIETVASGEAAFAHGYGATADAYVFSTGKLNKTTTPASPSTNTGDLFVVGNGIQGGAKSNAFRVTASGQVMGTQAYTASGADFAEAFEWLDGNPENEDRRGLFVTLEGEKIRLASAEDDYILGAVSATPTVIGDAHTDDWQGKYETDVFGSRVVENDAWKLSESFDTEEDEEYTSRLDRKEWAAVGLVGKLIVIDDGSCQVNGYCKPGKGGVATATDSGFRVMARVDETHVKVLVK